MSEAAGRTFAILLGMLFVLGSGASPQQPSAPSFKDTTALPDGVVGERIRSVIEVINSGSPDRIKRFLDEECAAEYREAAPLEEHVAATLEILRETGGIDFYSVRTYAPERPGRTVIVLKDRAQGRWWGLVLRLGEAPAFLVTVVGMDPVPPPAGRIGALPARGKSRQG